MHSLSSLVSIGPYYDYVHLTDQEIGWGLERLSGWPEVPWPDQIGTSSNVTFLTTSYTDSNCSLLLAMHAYK